MTGAKKLEVLDGLRGIAVLSVIAFHHRLMSEGEIGHSTLYTLLAPSRFGYAGVHLFLVLSGFCLTHSLIRRARAGQEPTLRTYLIHRWRRIAPPFYAAMALYLFAAAAARAFGLWVPPHS